MKLGVVLMPRPQSRCIDFGDFVTTTAQPLRDFRARVASADVALWMRMFAWTARVVVSNRCITLKRLA